MPLPMGIKSVIRKCIQNKEDINLALLDIHATPLDVNIPSPGEQLFNRKLATVLQSQSEVSSKDQREQMYESTTRGLYYNNMHRHPLPTLMKHQDVCVLVNDKWIPGRIIEKAKEPCSFIVQCQTHCLHRNCSHIRPLGNNNRPEEDCMPSFVESNDVSANFRNMPKISETENVCAKIKNTHLKSF